jgi:hypothetical protein
MLAASVLMLCAIVPLGRLKGKSMFNRYVDGITYTLDYVYAQHMLDLTGDDGFDYDMDLWCYLIGLGM